MTEQPSSLAALMGKYTVNKPTLRRVPLARLGVHGRRLVFGVTGYTFPNPFALEFIDGGLIARDYQLDLDNIVIQIAEDGVFPVSMVTRAKGIWGSDGAYLLDGSPPVTWEIEPGPDLGPHPLCVEITKDLYPTFRAQELEHFQDFATAWVLTVGIFVERLPTSGYSSAGDALEALAAQFDNPGTKYLVPSGSLREPQVWVKHLKSRAVDLANQSGKRDDDGSHSPASYKARLDNTDDKSRIILTPVSRPAGPPRAVLDVKALLH
ncbi:hypothetical protein [Streptomyces sp. NPDC002690]